MNACVYVLRRCVTAHWQVWPDLTNRQLCCQQQMSMLALALTCSALDVAPGCAPAPLRRGSSMLMHADHCEMAPLYVTTYFIFNVAYNVVLIVILKYGR
jgi:CRT-like, chloroquine-resistance transporter-like